MGADDGRISKHPSRHPRQSRWNTCLWRCWDQRSRWGRPTVARLDPMVSPRLRAEPQPRASQDDSLHQVEDRENNGGQESQMPAAKAKAMANHGPIMEPEMPWAEHETVNQRLDQFQERMGNLENALHQILVHLLPTSRRRWACRPFHWPRSSSIHGTLSRTIERFSS